MKQPILERYPRTDDGRLAIDITTRRIEDLYNDFDKTAPYLKKDLDQDLVNYLIDSVRELGTEKFVIRIRTENPVDEAPKSRIRDSVRNYFVYLRDVEKRELNRVLKTSLILFVAGLAILTLSVWVNRILEAGETVSARVFAEGLTIAAWVAIWEALANFLINWSPYRRKIRIFERISGASVDIPDVSTSGHTGAPK